MKNMKKTICFLIALVMLLSFAAFHCFAEELLTDTALPEQETIEETDKDDAVLETPKMIFEPGNFIANLNYMGLGMLGIFVVIGVIVLCTMALNKAFKERNE